MAILARSLTCPDHILPFFLTTNNNVKSGLATQDYIYTSLSMFSVLAMSYFVIIIIIIINTGQTAYADEPRG